MEKVPSVALVLQYYQNKQDNSPILLNLIAGISFFKYYNVSIYPYNEHLLHRVYTVL